MSVRLPQLENGAPCLRAPECPGERIPGMLGRPLCRSLQLGSAPALLGRVTWTVTVNDCCRSLNLEECMADCAASGSCGCAYFRVNEESVLPGSGWCSLTTADCADPVIGAQPDHTRVRSAIVKCGYQASPAVKATWPKQTFDGVDWFGVWEDTCEYKEPFTHMQKNSFCGPACVVPGTHTSLCVPSALCAAICMTCCWLSAAALPQRVHTSYKQQMCVGRRV